MSRIRLFWDFFGPSAPRTAEHLQHLDEFLARELRHGLRDRHQLVGLRANAAYCVAPLEASEGLQRAPDRAAASPSRERRTLSYGNSRTTLQLAP